MKNDEASPPPARPIAAVIQDHTAEMLAIPGVVGLYEGALDDGTHCIKIMVIRKTSELRRRLPERLEGYPVRIDVTGAIRPLSPENKP